MTHFPMMTEQKLITGLIVFGLVVFLGWCLWVIGDLEMFDD